jgi:hypothetical protein
MPKSSAIATAVLLTLGASSAFAAPRNIDDMATTDQCSGTLSRTNELRESSANDLALLNADTATWPIGVRAQWSVLLWHFTNIRPFWSSVRFLR